MANPNIVNVTSILGKSVQATLTTTLTTEILACPSDKLIKINSIIVANIDGSSSVDISVFITKSGGSPLALASTVALPADSSIVVIDQNNGLYLQEGDNIEAGAGANSDAVITISYEELDDA